MTRARKILEKTDHLHPVFQMSKKWRKKNPDKVIDVKEMKVLHAGQSITPSSTSLKKSPGFEYASGETKPSRGVQQAVTRPAPKGRYR